MYPFERYMKKLKNYVRNKAKPEGSIAKGYVAEEALTFSSHYFRDVTMKFNHPDHNVDCTPPTCQLQVFKSLCKSIGLRSVIRIDHQELKKVIWYVLHNSPEIDTYQAKFKIEFPNKDMKEEFPGWFEKQIHQRHVDNDSGVNESNMARRPLGWKVIEHVSHKKFLNGGVIVVEDDPDVIHVDNSSDLALSTSLNDLEITALHIDGQPIDVDAPLDIIDGTRKPNLGGRRAGRLYTRQETRKLGLKTITDKSGPVPIRFEVEDRETLMPLSDHAAHWANYLGELVRELPLHYPSWRQMPPERKARVMAKIGFDLRPHMESDRWPQINAGIQQHLQKIYNDWDAQLAFWNDPKNLARAAQNKQNRAKSKVVCRQGSRSIAAFRDMHMETSATTEYPSLIHTFFLTHTVGGDEMLRVQSLGSNTLTGVPYTEDEIMAIVCGGKQRGHIPGVGQSQPKYGGGSESGECGDDEDGGEDEEEDDS
nr:hypothetical protein [Tanacetum cinerariifolium]